MNNPHENEMWDISDEQQPSPLVDDRIEIQSWEDGICKIVAYIPCECKNARGHAKLIAAAPDMLKALLEVKDSTDPDDYYIAVHNAIEKALGS